MFGGQEEERGEGWRRHLKAGHGQQAKLTPGGLNKRRFDTALCLECECGNTCP